MKRYREMLRREAESIGIHDSTVEELSDEWLRRRNHSSQDIFRSTHSALSATHSAVEINYDRISLATCWTLARKVSESRDRLISESGEESAPVSCLKQRVSRE